MVNPSKLSSLIRWTTLLLAVAASLWAARPVQALDRELIDLHAVTSAMSPLAPLVRSATHLHPLPAAGGRVGPAGDEADARTPPLHVAQDRGAADCPPLLRHSFNRLQTGEPQSLCQFTGKVLLVVNTASYCGYTSQYDGLEALHRKYGQRGLVVVGFPTNDFGNQEPGTNKEIAEFCRTTYGIQFPMFEKTTVGRLDANPFYATLIEQSGQRPRWNFHKYIVDRNGRTVRSFGSDVTPEHKDLVGLIERLLGEKPAAAQG